MASNKSVVVLAPNGRRQNVKVTPNTTILQVLEEVCHKQGFKPEEYDIRHHNHVLDTTSLMQFSGLPNNAQLELSTATKTRSESNVILGVQLENGKRLTGTFLPNDSLWIVLTKLCPEEAQPEKNPVVIYMRREIHGQASFKEITLRNLGLVGGRAMLRLIHRKPEELKIQANVSTPLPSRPTPEIPFKRPYKKIETVEIVKNELESTNSHSSSESEPRCIEKMQIENSDHSNESASLKCHAQVHTINPRCNEIVDLEEQSTNANQPVKSARSDEEIAFLGERNAIAFSLSMAHSLPHEDLPDEFYDLNINDAKTLLKDLKRRRAEMEETPLQTSALRALEENKKVLRQLNQYKRSVLRVQFPDRTVLQGTFTPLETVETVMSFVQGYLEDSSLQFYLYTTPPKHILKPETRLVDAQCVPCAVVHFGTTNVLSDGTRYLRKDLLLRLTSFDNASLVACQSRGLMNKPKQYVAHAGENVPVSLPSTSPQASNSTGATPKTPRYYSKPIVESDPSKKYPKWFRPSK